MSRQTKSRGAVKRDDYVFVGAWVPESWMPRIDAAIRAQDTDRSKFLRRALAKQAGLQIPATN